MFASRRHFHLLLVVAVLALHLPSRPAYAFAPDARTTTIVSGLQSFARSVLEPLGTSRELVRPLPLTPVSLASGAGLRLTNVFSETFQTPGNLQPSYDSLDTLAEALKHLSKEYTGVVVKVENVTIQESAPARVDVLFTLRGERQISLPLDVEQPPLTVRSGSYDATLAFSMSLHFQLDTRQGIPSGQAFALVDAPTIAIEAHANSPVNEGRGRVGFSEVTVNGNVALNAAAAGAIIDPDRDGRITQDEWSTTAFEDLVPIAYTDQPGDDVNAVLNVEALPIGGRDLFPGSPDGTLTLNDPNMSDGLLQPRLQLGPLASFANVTPSQILSGVQSFTAALGTAHLLGDRSKDGQHLPFGDTRLISSTVLIDPFVRFIHSQGDAAVLCGSQDRSKDSSPPVGDPDIVAPGGFVYCQAITLKKPTSVTWTGALTNSQNLDTTGSHPTATAQFKSANGGMPDVTVTFTDDAGQSHTVYPLFRSAQEFYTRLDAALASSNAADSHGIEVGFDSQTSSLTYHITLDRHPQPEPFTLSFGDTLTQTVGLFNLHSNDQAKMQIALTNLAIDATFGIIMVSTPEEIVPKGTDADRFFLKVRNGPGQYEISADATLTGQVAIDGQIGALEVTSGAPQSTATVSRSNGNTPMLAIDIKPLQDGIHLQNGTSIADAITLPEFLSHTLNYVQPSLHMKLASDLHLEAKNYGAALGSGDVHIDWPDVGSGRPNATLTDSSSAGLTIFRDYSSTNPHALTDAVIASLNQLLQGLDAANNGTITAKMPVIGYSPKELLTLDQLEKNLTGAQTKSIRSLQQLSAELGNVLSFSLTEPSSLTTTQGQQASARDLVIRLNYSKTDNTPLPLRFYLSLSGQPTLVESEANGSNSTIAYTATTDIRLGLPLTSKGGDTGVVSPYIFSNSTATVEAVLNTSHVSFGIGALSLRLAADGQVRFGAAITLHAQSTANTLDIPAFVKSLTVDAHKPADFPAGNCGAANGQPLDGDVCARLTLKLNDQPLPLDVGFRIQDAGTLFHPDDLSDPTGWYFTSPKLNDLALNTPLDWDRLTGSLPVFLDVLTTTLKAAQPVPLIGKDLDAGAKVVDEINERVVKPLNNLDAELKACNTIDALKQAIQRRLDDGTGVGCASAQAATSATNAARVASTAADDLVKVTAIAIDTFCGDKIPCGGSNTPADITDVQIHLTIGGTKAATVPFDLGVGGVPLNIKGGLASSVNWSLPLAFGLSREQGPYFGTDDPAYKPALTLSAKVGLDNLQGPPLPDVVPDPLKGYTSTRTLNGTLGFLQINLYDKDTDTDRTQAGFEIGVTTSTPVGRVPIEQIATALSGFQVTNTSAPSVKVNLLFRAGLANDDQGQIPDILGTLTIPDAGSFAKLTPERLFGNALYLDASGLRNSFLKPVLNTVENVSRPVQPVINTLYAPIPGISDISRMTTGHDITLANLIQTNLDSELLDHLAGLAKFASDIDRCAASGIVEISTDISFDKLCSSQSSSQLIAASSTNATLADEPVTPAAGLTFPFIEHRANILNLLLGQDVVLMRFDAGKLRGSGGFQQTFGPITVGPIPISIGVSASVSVEGRFAMGYDTVGLREAAGNGQAARLIDGLFLDDFDENGMDVPEIAVGGTVAIAAAIDAGIVAAGIEGGVNLTLGLNLHEDDLPNDPKDGRIHYSQIANKLNNPICLFDATGKLSAFLSAFVRVGFSFFSETFDFKIAEVTLLDFSTNLCANPPKPDLAEVYHNNLVLHMGPLASLRHLDAGPDEKFTVRQISAENAYPPGTDGGTRVSISAYGITEEETIPKDGRVLAYGGTGNDTISLEAGVDLKTHQPIPFTLSSWLGGGSGDDELKGGLDDDILCGDKPVVGQEVDKQPHPCTMPMTITALMTEKQISLDDTDKEDGNDTLTGNAGNDIIYGGAKDDRIDGGLGNDKLYGEVGNDVINGGPGADQIDGGADNDRLIGGPGTNRMADPSKGQTASDGASPDLDDIIIGGPGNDYIEGGFGNDTLYGDDTLPTPSDAEKCNANNEPGNGQSDDIIQGGPDDDLIFGGPGNDHLAGQDGNDTIYGNGGDDEIDGEGEGTLIGGGNDTLIGGADNDTLHGQGGDDTIFGCAGDDHLYGDDGRDNLSGGQGTDVLEGGADRDYLFGDDGFATRQVGQEDATAISFSESSGQGDTIHGDDDDDVIYGEGGDDFLYGDAGQDVMHGNDGKDTMHGGAENDLMLGEAGDDSMFGDSGNDRMFGNDGGDTMRGGIGDDYMEGNGGIDTMFGDADQDDMIGGSASAGVPDMDDTMDGGGQQDYLAGDNAQITRPGGVTTFDNTTIRTVQLLDVDSADGTLSGGDRMFGGDGNDRMFGQGANDLMRGGAGDDFIQGNAAADEIYGDAGQDDIIGGSDSPGHLDGADTIHGGDGVSDQAGDADVVAGDNAKITRPLSFGSWRTNLFDGSIARNVQLFDLSFVGREADPRLSGGDIINGDGDNDLLYGQGGDDTINGGSGDDYMEGNSGNDTMSGGAGQDDMIGGGADVGRSDGNDTMTGGDGRAELVNDFDVLAGDNAAITRPLSCGRWQANAADGSIYRNVTLFDVALAGGATIVGGDDKIAGEGSNDRIYGEGGNDTISGGGGDDYIEGNAGDDTAQGGDGNDDIVGGTGRINSDPPTGTMDRLDGSDTLDGNAGFDVIAGDNALIVRKQFGTTPQVPCQAVVGGTWKQNSFNAGIQHQPIVLLDVDSKTRASASDADMLNGGDNDDMLYGQAGDDTINGGAGDDYLEGNGDGDTLSGDAGQDDIIGGNSAEKRSDDRPDRIRGGDGNDVVLGDNGSITRPLTNGRWSIDSASGSVVRAMKLFDVPLVGQPVGPRTGSSDFIDGDGGNDLLFGQVGDDVINGDDGDDYIEGNGGNDQLNGGGGDDDIIGGSSSGNGVIAVGSATLADARIADQQWDATTDAETAAAQAAATSIDSQTAVQDQVAQSSAAKDQADGDDSIHGGDGDDVLLGDNGSISRPIHNGHWQRLTGFGYDLVVRQVKMAHTAERSGAYGNDTLYGENSHDDLYGQLGDDMLDGGAGEDALVGDLGQVTPNLLGDHDHDPSELDVQLTTSNPSLHALIFAKGSLLRVVELFAATSDQKAGGNDTLLGGDGNDYLHGGSGNDLMNGGTGNDAVFGGDGDDVIWGGSDNDHLWGGYGNDYIDVAPRPAMASFPADPAAWFTYGDQDNNQGADVMYGGWGQDALQADQADEGSTQGDRLIDWSGSYNVSYSCIGTNAPIVTQERSDSLTSVLQRLAEGDGALVPKSSSSSGYREVGMVFSGDVAKNAKPAHPDGLQHFVCQ